MLQSYSIGIDVGADTPIPFNNVSLRKGCTVTQSGVSTFDLNKCGIYHVEVDGTATAETTFQLYKDGVALPQAQSTGTTLGFSTLVQVDHNNCDCACASPTRIQVVNTTATNVDDNIVITKLV